VAIVGEYGHVARCDEPHARGDGLRDGDYGHVAATLASIAPVYWLMAAVYWLMAAFYCLMAPFYCLMKKDDWPSPAVLAVPSGGDVVLQPPHLLSMSEPEPEAAPLMREFLDYAHITNPETAEGEQRTDSLVLRERSLGEGGKDHLSADDEWYVLVVEDSEVDGAERIALCGPVLAVLTPPGRAVICGRGRSWGGAPA
jgi:hypothetical protein